MLDIVANYHCVQFQGKLMNQTSENGKKPSFGPNFGPFGPNRGSNYFFFNMALSVTRYHGSLLSYTISKKY